MQACLLHFWDEAGLAAREQLPSATIFPVEPLHCTLRVRVPPAGARRGSSKLSGFGASEKLGWKREAGQPPCRPVSSTHAHGRILSFFSFTSSPPQLLVQGPHAPAVHEYVMQVCLLHFWDEAGLLAPEQLTAAITFPVESLHCTLRTWVPPTTDELGCREGQDRPLDGCQAGGLPHAAYHHHSAPTWGQAADVAAAAPALQLCCCC